MAEKDIIEIINNAEVEKLIEAGKRIGSTDYAVRFFYSAKHPKFYMNEEALRHALRREATQNAFGRADIIREVLTSEQRWLTNG